MQSRTDGFIYVALILALLVAILSSDRTGQSRQISRWLMAGMSPESEALAGAIGEHPEEMMPP